MKEETFRLRNAPIVEAILDIDCDMPADFNIADVQEAAENVFLTDYPIKGSQQAISFQVALQPENTVGREPTQQVNAWRFQSPDGKQFLQVRVNGFTFNRLAPYTSLDEYIPEIQQKWTAYVGLASPLIARTLRLRYLNLIHLPVRENGFNISDYLSIAPKRPFDDGSLIVRSFANQQVITETGTGNEVRMTLANYTAQIDRSDELTDYVVLFDIQVSSQLDCEPSDWDRIAAKIRSLRNLKNRVFKESLTEKCIQLFQ